MSAAASAILSGEGGKEALGRGRLLAEKATTVIGSREARENDTPQQRRAVAWKTDLALRDYCSRGLTVEVVAGGLQGTVIGTVLWRTLAEGRARTRSESRRREWLGVLKRLGSQI